MLGSTCSLAKKNFKVNVACADGMLMSPVTFPEVSGQFFWCTKWVWRENKDVITLRYPLISSYSSQNGSSIMSPTCGMPGLRVRHEADIRRAAAPGYIPACGLNAEHIYISLKRTWVRPDQSRAWISPSLLQFDPFFNFLHFQLTSNGSQSYILHYTQFWAVNAALLLTLLGLIDSWRLRIMTHNLKEPSGVTATGFADGWFKLKLTLALKFGALFSHYTPLYTQFILIRKS